MKKIIAFLYIVFSLLLTACEEQENVLQVGNTIGKEVTFSISTMSDVQTRATDISFEDGDEIGIYVVSRGLNLQNTGNYADNKRFVFRGGTLRPYSNEDNIYISAEAEYNYYAYYPYTPGITPCNWVIDQVKNQRIYENYRTANAMSAIAQNVRGLSVPLNFKHLFGLIEARFKKVPSIDKIDSVAIFNCRSKCATDLQTGTQQLITSSGKFSMYKYGEDANYYTYRCLLPAQIILANTTLFTTYCTNHKNTNTFFNYNNTTDLTLQKGVKTPYALDAVYRLTAYSQNNWGTVSINKNRFKYGEVATIKAIGGDDYEIAAWYLLPDLATKVSTDPVYSFTLTEDRVYCARFQMKSELLNIKVTTNEGTNGGTVTGNGDKVQRYQEWSVLATSDFERGYLFGGWYDENGKLLDTYSLYEFTMPNHTLNLEARFVKSYYNVGITKTGNGEAVAVILHEGGGWYSEPQVSLPKNSQTGVEARLYSGSRLEGWYENGIRISTANPYRFSVNKDRNIIANIIKI